VLGAMPTEHVVTMLGATPPHRAVQVLLAMPADRIVRLIAAMDGRLIARLLIAADPARRATLLGFLDDTRLAAELALLPLVEAAEVMTALPPDRAGAQLDRVSSEHLSMMLDEMPGPARRRLVDVLDPMRLADLRRVTYERAVIDSLRRTSANLSWVPEDNGSNLYAALFHRVFGISLCYLDSGALPGATVAAAQHAFGQGVVHGLLVVSNAWPSPDSLHQIADQRWSMTPGALVTWNADDNDGVLGRALVRLAG
jgi:Mg/Co/Ni transporter MgtE